MKCVMVMFDSLNRHHLPPYGCDWTHAPNFSRLAARTATFDTSYVCSMPCMPARRDLHTGRPNFLHRSWSPLEPFDDSMFEILKTAGVHSHLVTDHYHYWEDGGATYHNRYSSYEFVRGQEGDTWQGVADPDAFAAKPGALGRNAVNNAWQQQDRANRDALARTGQTPQGRTFRAGLDYIECNKNTDNWILQIETFDPHEPFVSPRTFKDLYANAYDPTAFDFDWPVYRSVDPAQGETPEAVHHIRHEYASLLSMCDAHLGDVLDAFDRDNLWADTMLVVWTDHGFLLGEHDCWAKVWMPFYEEVAHTPFFVYDPRSPGAAGTRRAALVQPSIDLAPTLLSYFSQEPTPDMIGKNLAPVIASDTPVREAAIFGIHGGQVNVTDGRYVYMRPGAIVGGRDGGILNDYTLMPTRMRNRFEPGELQNWQVAPPFSFTKGCPTMRIPAGGLGNFGSTDTLKTFLWDVQTDPAQNAPLSDAATEARMAVHLSHLLLECDAPSEQYVRLNVDTP